MPLVTALCQRLGIAHPVIQAPMGGGASTPELTTAACEAGALGYIAAAYLTPAQIAAAAADLRARTARPWGINLFAPVPCASDAATDPRRAIERLAPLHAELGLAPPELSAQAIEPFEGQMRAVLECGARVFSFTFGIAPPDAIAAAKSRGMFVMGTATTVEEALALEAAGVDAVVAQGSEAGAHRGTFLGPFEMSLVGTMALVPSVVDAVRIPVVASGGIMDGRGIAAALALGAQAVQMGTAFLTSTESGTPSAHKRAILDAREDATRITRAFSGRHARGIVNRAMEHLEPAGNGDALLPYPLQNSLTRPMRNAAGRQGRAEFISLWAGQGLRLAREEGAARMIERWMNEAGERARLLG